jgi:hypothetical protein
MRTHLSSRFAPSRVATRATTRAATRAVVSAVAVLLTVVTPVAVAATATAAQPSPAAVDTAAPKIETKLSHHSGHELGRRMGFSADFTNGDGSPVKAQRGLMTVAYGKHVNARLEPTTPDPSKVVVEQYVDRVWERLPLTAGKNGTLRAAINIAAADTHSPGPAALERFRVTIDRSVPADVNMGEVSVGAYADGTAMHTVGFSLKHTQSEPEVRFDGITSRPELVTGGKPVEFTATVSNNTGKDISLTTADYFFISPGSGDLDPQHVTVERRDSSGAWVPVDLREQYQLPHGNLDKGVLKQGTSRTYTLRLALTKHFPGGIKRGGFTLESRQSNATFDFTVKHEGASTPDPSVNRDLTVTTTGIKGATALKRGGAAKEFTATVTNKGNVSQQPMVLMEITDKDLKRRMQAGQIHVQQYVKAAAEGWKNVKVTASKEGGHLMAAIEPRTGFYEPELAPGDSAVYQLRLAATDANKAQAFTVDLEARAKLSSTRISLPFTVSGAATATPTPSQTPQPGTTAQAVNIANPTSGEMAQTGSESSTPLLIGAGGLLVAIGAGAVLNARRRAF